MIPDEAAAPPSLPAVAAPRRAVRLMAKPLAPREERPAAKPRSAQEFSTEPTPPAALERKLAGLHDAQDMLRVMNTELVLQRTARLHGSGGKSRQAMRVLSITILFGLLIAALAAMSWMQSRLAQKGFSRHRAEIQRQK